MRRLPATAYLPFTPARTANCILMLMFGVGLGVGDLPARASLSGLYLFLALIAGYLCLLWCRGDSAARGFTRSRLLSVAVAVLPLAAVPYYLLRSRQAADRGPALGAFLGLLISVPLAALAGAAVHLAIRHAAS